MRFPTMLLFLFFNLILISYSVAQPNILLVIADDVGVDPIPNYTPNTVKANMPNLEGLMSEGLTFDNAWSNPLCSPTRATILTGKYGFRTNVLNAQGLNTLSLDETSLHVYIDQSSNGNYSSSLIGKWHLGGNSNQLSEYPNELGIEYFAGLMSGGVMDYYDWDLTINGQSTNTTEYITTKFTDLAIDWINDQNEPWFCWLAYNAPHTPFHLPPLEMHSQGDLPTDQASIDANPLPYYLAMLESVDYEMGRLFENIPSDVLENTVIIFIGDNGTPRQVIQNPYALSQSKGSLYQGGVHVPMVISGKGVNRQNEREEALVNMSDLFATIVELTGTTLDEIHDSYSIEHLLNEATGGLRDCAYTEIVSSGNSPSGWTARDETFKLINFEDDPNEFYNLIDDPYEKNNLFMGTLNSVEQASFDKLINVFDDLSTPVSEVDFSTEILIAYPNPTPNELSLEWTELNKSTYSIVDVSGRILGKGILNQGVNTIGVEHLDAGVYFLKTEHQFLKFLKM